MKIITDQYRSYKMIWKSLSWLIAENLVSIEAKYDWRSCYFYRKKADMRQAKNNYFIPFEKSIWYNRFVTEIGIILH